MFKYYTMNQVVLPLDLEIILPENDIAFAVNDLIKNIPDEAFESFLEKLVFQLIILLTFFML